MSQAQSVTGTVVDSVRHEAINYASVRLLNSTDSTFVVGAITTEDGSFNIRGVIGEYILDISYVGCIRYQKHIQISNKKLHLNLGTIYLVEADYLLGETVITAPIPDIIVKGDTIEYNADAYKLTEDALLQDLVRRLPGVEISSDGKIMANGKIINKILIDGKEFFDNDIDLALKNLPASMVNKLQLFKEESEKSKVTGFKDADSQQVINLTVKDGYKRSIFGNAKIGYGTDHRYSNKINAQYMVDDNQFALIGNENNVTDDFEYSGLSSQYDGITKNKDIGFNFNSQRNKNLQVGGSIKYNSNDNLFQMKTNTRSFIESGDRISNQISSTNSIRKDLRLGANLKWTPDSLTTIFARLSIGTGTNDEKRHSTNDSYIIAQKDTTSGKTDYMSSGDTHNLIGSFVFGRKLNSLGRTISVSMNGSTNGVRSHGSNKSFTLYPDYNTNKIIDQLLSVNNNSNTWSVMLSYVEPLSKGKSLQFSYSYRTEHSDRERFTFKRDGEGEYTVIDTAYTRSSASRFDTQRINLSYQSIKERFEYTVGFNIDPSYSKNSTNIGDSVIERQKQSVLNFSPTLRLTYNPKKNISFDIDYYGSTEQPSLRQLSSDTIIVDALSKIYGNPDLKPSYQNTINMYFQKSNYEKGSFISISGGGNYTFNKIVDYTLIDKLGNTESSFRNVNGNWGMNGGLTFSTPLRNKKLSIDNSSYAYLMRNIGFSNGIKNITTNLTMSESFSILYRSEKLNQKFQANISYNITRNNLPNQDNLNVINYGFKSSTQWSLPYDFSIQNEMSYVRNVGYADEFKKSEFLWNLALAKQFLKKKQATLKLQCYDIFNDRNNILRVTSGNYISDTRTNMIGRYFLLSLNFRFNIIPKGSENSNIGATDSNYL